MTTAPEQPQKKKGLSPLAWVAIGCGALVVIGLIALAAGVGFVGHKVKQYADEVEANPALAAARAIAFANPEIELVEDESTADVIVFRHEETGEIFRVDASEVAEGRISFEGSEGTVAIDARGDGEGGQMTVTTPEGSTVYRGGEEAALDLPDWVMRYPGAVATGTFSSRGAQGESGAFSMTTDDEAREVLDYYERELQEAGYEVQVHNYGAQAGMVGMVTGSREGRQINVTVAEQEGRTQATVQYSSEGG